VQGKLAGGRRLLMFLLGAASLLAQAETAPPPPAEVKKTVDAFVGHWILTGTDLEPGATAPSRGSDGRWRVAIDGWSSDRPAAR